MHRLIIGDIHGCYDELQALLEKAGLGADDEIIAIGDIVDRGPASDKVLAFFQTTPHAYSIMGNHERKHIRSFRGQLEPAASQTITRHQIGEAAYPAAIDFMSQFRNYLELPEALLVHAFFEPGIRITEQRDTVIVGTLTGESYLKDNGLWPWYERYDGNKPLIVGHRDYTDTMQPFVYQNRVYGLDSRCCYGGSLTGLLLPEFRLISVPSRGNHWAVLQHQYADMIRDKLL